MHEIEIREDIVESICEFFPVAGIAAGLEACVFGPHVALGSGEVAEKIAESESAGFERPFDLRGWNAASDSESARADFFKMVEELSGFGIFHIWFRQKIIGTMKL